ncbi:MAG: efflux RND transporter permease subunit [Francisellaceae bacterium]
MIAFFVRHKIAAHTLMLLMLLMGGWGIYHLNVQFLPKFTINFITVTVVWPGASATDTEASIIPLLENQLNDIGKLKKIQSAAKTGSATVILEFKQGADMSSALQDVQEKVASIDNLPQGSEKPVVTKIEFYEPVARVIISGIDSHEALRTLSYRYERQLLDMGITKIELYGLYEQQMLIKVPITTLHALGLSLSELGDMIDRQSQNRPIGEAAKELSSRQLRVETAAKTIAAMMNLPIDRDSYLYRLGDMAVISLEKKENEQSITYQGQPAVEMILQRTSDESSFVMAERLHRWYEQMNFADMQSVHLKLYDEKWLLIDERINLLLENGITGLIFILLILMLFLRFQVAIWVAAGIPIAFMATFFMLYYAGGSIDMVSLFAIIMALGFIVDDAIVVGEQAYTNFENGEPPANAAIYGARRMLIPVLASSLTTVAAFIPLMLVGDITGEVLFAIPVVVICVIIASLIECFMILPKHLEGSFIRLHHHSAKPRAFRAWFDSWFDYIKNQYCRVIKKTLLGTRSK